MTRALAGRLTLDGTPDGGAAWVHIDKWGIVQVSPPADDAAEALAMLDDLHPAYADLAATITAEDVGAMWDDATSWHATAD